MSSLSCWQGIPSQLLYVKGTLKCGNTNKLRQFPSTRVCQVCLQGPCANLPTIFFAASLAPQKRRIVGGEKMGLSGVFSVCRVFHTGRRLLSPYCCTCTPKQAQNATLFAAALRPATAQQQCPACLLPSYHNQDNYHCWGDKNDHKMPLNKSSSQALSERDRRSAYHAIGFVGNVDFRLPPVFMEKKNTMSRPPLCDLYQYHIICTVYTEHVDSSILENIVGMI